MASLTGKVVFITGAGRGIGRATALALARAGARVAAADLDGDAAVDAAEQCGHGSRGYALDVTDHAAYTEVLDQVETELGPLDVLVNVAGIMPIGPLADEAPETSAKVIAINLVAMMHGTHEAIRRMQPRGHGHILNVSSGAGKIAAAGGASYGASKFGVVGMTDAVEQELRGTGIAVSLVMPGVVETAMGEGLKSLRGTQLLAPEDVATAILEAIQKPRFEVYVPKSLGRLTYAMTVMPRWLRLVLGRVAGADTLLLDADHSARAANYDAQAHANASRDERATASPRPASAPQTTSVAPR